MNQLPPGWRSQRLSDVAAEVRGSVDPSPVQRYQLWSVPSFSTGQPELVAGASIKSAKRPVQAGDVLLCKINPRINRVWQVGPQPEGAIQIASTEWISLRPDVNRVSPEYLRHYLSSPPFRDWIVGQVSGVTGSHTRAKPPQVLQQLIPVPPLEEQQRIVAILDDHLSRLDAATEAARTSLLRLSALRLSALTTARNQLVEEGSAMRPLGAVAQTALGKMLDAKRAAGTPTPYLRNINVRWGSFELDDLQEVPLSAGERERLALQEGDLLVCEGGEPGRCAVWPGFESLVSYQKALHRVRTKDPESVDVHFLAVMLEEFIKAGRADEMFTGTTIRHLPQEKLRLVELPIPTLKRQRDVLRSLDSLGEGAALLRNDLGKVESRAASVRRSLLTAAFSGQLTASNGLHEEVA